MEPENPQLETIKCHNRRFFSVVPDSIVETSRKIQIQKAGGMVKARFEGSRNSVFGANPGHARKRLQYWE
jgi:hypothetical protein